MKPGNTKIKTKKINLNDTIIKVGKSLSNTNNIFFSYVY